MESSYWLKRHARCTCTWLQALAAALAPKAKAVRDKNVKTIEAIGLVPGDVIIIRLGDIVPADVKILPEEGGGAGEEVPMQVLRVLSLLTCSSARLTLLVAPLRCRLTRRP